MGTKTSQRQQFINARLFLYSVFLLREPCFSLFTDDGDSWNSECPPVAVVNIHKTLKLM